MCKLMTCHLGLLLPFVDIHLVSIKNRVDLYAFTNDCFLFDFCGSFCHFFRQTSPWLINQKEILFKFFILKNIYWALFSSFKWTCYLQAVYTASGFGYQYSVCHVWRAIRFFSFLSIVVLLHQTQLISKWYLVFDHKTNMVFCGSKQLR